jgi:malonyl CoA-acyl carrier protein transacylase/3-oxoacyl-(acyl-carrier-protein) synthase/NAD(P)-dependent dehydrogenase (short-subunit alcohol dehydrogenase family)
LTLMQTAITQPAMLTMDTALYKLLAEYGFAPDMVMGHSLGEYAALIAAGIMPFADALEASAARGAEMTKVSMDDNGWMAAVMAPLEVVEATLKEVDGYAVAANINSYNQAVVGGASKAVEQAIGLFEKKGYRAQRIPVSHAFHTKIVAPASKPLRKVLDRLRVSEPKLPLVANVTGDIYPTTVEGIKDILELQIASPVQWVKGLETMYREGVRTFVEVGPKRALKGFVDDVLGTKPEVWSLLTNHPKNGEIESFNQALCGLYAAGYGVEGRGARGEGRLEVAPIVTSAPVPVQQAVKESVTMTQPPANASNALGQALLQALQQLSGAAPLATRNSPLPYDRNDEPSGSIVITGTGLGLPGANKSVMDPDNAMRILRGEQFVDLIPERFRREMATRRITRLVKSEDGSGSFEVIDNSDDVIKLAGRGGGFDLEAEYGVPGKLIEALDITTQLAMAAGLDALREAGIPLTQTYRTTSKGTFLPDRWLLPAALRDETGVIFASAFPGGDRFADEFKRFYEFDNRRRQIEMLEDILQYTSDPDSQREIVRKLNELKDEQGRTPYEFDRRFIFRILAMGHSQFAEYIGARGPNTHVNAACASTAQGVALAEDWIRNGRCRRVIVVGADDVTSENLMGWVGSGFLATGAAATDDKVEEAALPFDRRRHGTLLGMGACALVVESEDAVRERGMRGIVELLSSETANSAFHGTRLDVNHICDVMERLVSGAERRFGLNRYSMASQMAFISHETFTPARGGSAAAEIFALRKTFGEVATEIVVSNTKGFTGHPMGAGVEDVIAVKILEYGIVPPVPNFREVDPDLGVLNLSRGGRYPVTYALHLAAGFGSQISMTLIRRIPGGHDRVENKNQYSRWLADISGYDSAATEVVKRVLRIVAQGAPSRVPVASMWRYGTGPIVRSIAPGSGASTEYRPLPMPAVAAAARGEGRGAAPSMARGDVAAPVAPSKPVASAPVAPAPAPAPAPKPAEPIAPPPAPVQVAPAAPISQSPNLPISNLQPPAVDPVISQVLDVVAVKTGYPKDMLDLDLDMEADLGIDTVKQAETFAAIRETFSIPVQEGLNLREYGTLGRVVDYVRNNRPDLARGEGRGAEQSAVQSPQPAVVQSPISSLQSPVGDVVVEQVLDVVAEKTGYPKDMLDLDLDLEADLGIDTVKQAETFAAIRETFAIPVQEGLNLREYPTLASVVGFVRTNRPDLARGEGRGAEQSAVQSPQPAVVQSPISSLQSPVGDVVVEQVLDVVANKTGYPKDMLDLDLDLEADLGIDTVKQAETFAAIRETFAIPVQEGLNLREYPTLASVVGFVRTNRPDLAGTSQSAVLSHQSEVTPTAAIPHSAFVVPHSTDPVVEKVLTVVSEKTGYPTEMLELDQDMEADLGIDTVKQAETFASIRESFGIPVQEGLNLRDYPTLQSVIEFVRKNRPDLAGASQSTILSHQSEVAPTAAIPHSAFVVPHSTDPVIEKVLEVVAAKTGYPTEMLELDQDMEADLGIDTVKQAETFASIRESFGIPVQEGLNLRDYPTLQSVIEFVHKMRPDLGVAGGGAVTGEGRGATPISQSPNLPISNLQSPVSTVKTIGTLEDADKMPRRVPQPALRPSIDLCKPTGVSIDGSSRIVVMLDQGGVGKKLVEKLQKRGATVLTLEPGIATDALDNQLKAWLAEGKIQGVFWLPALDVEQAIEEMTLEEWRELNRVRVKNLYTAARALYDSVTGPNTFLVSATRLGGLHGYGPTGATAPLGGAVVGFTKAYNMEQAMREGGKGVTVKAVDFEPSRKLVEPADQLIAEALFDPGVVEVGYFKDQRFTVTLEEIPAKDGNPGMSLGKETVFVVTGAAGGITSAITTDLAANSGGIFYLLDLVPAPARDDQHIALFRQSRDVLKNALIAEARASGEKVTPKQIDDKIMGLERQEAALRAIEAVEGAGGTAYYYSLDLRDGDKVTAVVDDIRQRHGKIDVLLHAGGLLIDRVLPNKEPHQFALVFDVKADGFFSLIKAAKGMPIGATVSFSSVAGRFGNNGQSDYSSANDLLCKISSSMRTWRPETRGIAIDWTAWGQIGMASRGSVQAILESLGVDMLPPEAGVPTIRRELTYGATRGELVVAGRLGAWLDEKDPTGGLDVDKLNAQLAERKNPLLMVGQVKSFRLYGGIEVETVLDPKVQPFLFDHAPDEGTPWLPGVMATEALAQLASITAPGYRVASVEHEQMMGAFKFFRKEPRTLYLSATVKPAANGDLLATATLRSVTKPAKEGLPVQVKEHFIATVRLTTAPAEQPVMSFMPPSVDSLPTTAAEIYKSFFHGPAYQVIERAGVSGAQCLALMAHDLPANTAPVNAESIMAPRLIELCFQSAALWHTEIKHAMAFPLGFEKVTAYRQPEEAAGRRLYCVCTTPNDGESFDATVVDEAGNVFVTLAGYLTVARPA